MQYRLTCNSPPVLVEVPRACDDDRVAIVAPWPISVTLQTARAWPAAGVLLTFVVVALLAALWGMEHLSNTTQSLVCYWLNKAQARLTCHK